MNNVSPEIRSVKNKKQQNDNVVKGWIILDSLYFLGVLSKCLLCLSLGSSADRMQRLTTWSQPLMKFFLSFIFIFVFPLAFRRESMWQAHVCARWHDIEAVLPESDTVAEDFVWRWDWLVVHFAKMEEWWMKMCKLFTTFHSSKSICAHFQLLIPFSHFLLHRPCHLPGLFWHQDPVLVLHDGPLSQLTLWPASQQVLIFGHWSTWSKSQFTSLN